MPFDFRHPGEAQPDDTPEIARTMLFFLTGEPVPGLDGLEPFYAWASFSENGSVVATDYAPDSGWLEFTRSCT